MLLRKQKHTTWTLFLPIKHPTAVVKGKGVAGGHTYQLAVMSEDCKIKPEADATISVWLALSSPDLNHLSRMKTTHTTHKILDPITAFQLLVPSWVTLPLSCLTKCVIPVAWYNYSCANPLRYPQLSGQLVINHWQLLNLALCVVLCWEVP